MARSLQELVNIEDPEDRYGEALDVIVKLQDNVDSSLRKLLAFRESWCNQDALMNRLENWMITVEKELGNLRDPSGGHIRQFWVSNPGPWYLSNIPYTYSRKHKIYTFTVPTLAGIKSPIRGPQQYPRRSEQQFRTGTWNHPFV